MKPLAYLILPLLIVPAALGQGAVDFRNGGITFPTTAERRVYWCGRDLLVGTNYVAALYYLPGSDQGSGLWDPDGGLLARGSNNLAYAYFRPPSTSLPGVWLNPFEVGIYRYLDGVQPGEPATLQVRVWDITIYPDFRSAYLRGQFYVSAPFNYTVPLPGSPKEDYYLDNLRSASSPCALLLSVQRNGNALILSWTEPLVPGVVLEAIGQMGDSPGGSWVPVQLPYQTNEHRVFVTIPVLQANRFYRLHQR